MPLAKVEHELCTLAGQIASATCRFLCLLADFDARKGWAGVNIRSCAHWLSWRCGLDLRTAREHLRVARALAKLPRVRDVFAAGRISYSKVRAIARVATPHNEADLVDAALHAPAAYLERVTRGLHTAQDNTPGTGAGAGAGASPSGTNPSPQQPRFDTRWRWDDDGSLLLWGRMTPDDGARLLAGATRAEAERHRTTPDHDHPSDDANPKDTAKPGDTVNPDDPADSNSTIHPDRPGISHPTDRDHRPPDPGKTPALSGGLVSETMSNHDHHNHDIADNRGGSAEPPPAQPTTSSALTAAAAATPASTLAER